MRVILINPLTNIMSFNPSYRTIVTCWWSVSLIILPLIFWTLKHVSHQFDFRAYTFCITRSRSTLVGRRSIWMLL